MGCCLTTNNHSKASGKAHDPAAQPNVGASPSPAHPSLPVEEESVKEIVLSETPVCKNPNREMIKDNEEPPECFHLAETGQTATPISEPEPKPKNSQNMISEASEVSDICSFTESYSTRTVPEKEDDGDDEVTQNFPTRVPRKRPTAGRGRVRGDRGPARRVAQSPEKRSQVTSSRPVQGRPMTTPKRNAGRGNGVRREPGEISRRRSRSPLPVNEVRGRDVRSRSPGLRTTGPTVGRPPAKNEKPSDDGRNPGTRKMNSHGNQAVSPANDGVLIEHNESLENPVVSMECFIFL